ncbi:hypothetical protein OS493_036876 [Desmophyllum pertusum]|uniref:Grh/CP2 DB domain-containing protein n=1 Tax=Desmophyllum pertusum TaxID=174260 RepID=A0A9W9Z6N8_9CNID|nr:hypothetical protein OS493_036876 [Desmophyllum pertusum]
MDTIDPDSSSVPEVTTLTEVTSLDSTPLHSSTPLQIKQETLMACGLSPSQSAGSVESTRFIHILKAPTSPTKRLEEDSLTYLNQGQPYLVEMLCLDPVEAGAKFEGQYLKVKRPTLLDMLNGCDFTLVYRLK